MDPESSSLEYFYLVRSPVVVDGNMLVGGEEGEGRVG